MNKFQIEIMAYSTHFFCNVTRIYSERKNLEKINYALKSGISIAMTTEFTLKSQKYVFEPFVFI
jgi:hypothetical protein